jgi:hypothetical protein
VLPVGWLVGAVVVAILLTFWVTFTLTRMDRLHARVDAAYAALDAQLVRRAAALLHVLEARAAPVADSDLLRYERAASAALAADVRARERAENEVGRVVGELVERPVATATHRAEATELHEACVRVAIARRFYNDAVRDTRALRARRMPRILHLAGHRDMPRFFDIDDTVIYPAPPGGPPGQVHPERTEEIV